MFDKHNASLASVLEADKVIELRCCCSHHPEPSPDAAVRRGGRGRGVPLECGHHGLARDVPDAQFLLQVDLLPGEIARVGVKDAQLDLLVNGERQQKCFFFRTITTQYFPN